MRVSVVIPAFNGEKWISQAVQSVIKAGNKLGEDYEIVVRDDGSTDDTLKVLSKIKDKHLKVVKASNAGGIGASFDAAFRLATGKYVTVLGQDDLLDEDYLVKVIPEFKDERVMISCHPRFIDAEGKKFEKPGDPRLNIPKAGNGTRDQWLTLFRIGNLHFGLNTYLRQAVLDLGGFDVKAGWLLDQDLYTRIVQKYDIYVIQEELCSLGMRDDTTSCLSLKDLPNQGKYLRYLRQKNFTPTKMKVALATPFYMSQEFSHYGESMLHTCRMLTQAGIEWELIRVNGDSYVDRAKNTIMANFLETDCTDLIMIDSDEQWQPEAISRLLQHPEEIVTAAYPFKNNWGQFAGNPLVITKDGVDQYAGWRELSDGSCLLEAYNVSGGFMRIKRTAIEKYADAFPNDIYQDDFAWPSRKGRIYTAFFMCDIKDFQRYGEDAYFSRRMREIGIKLWIDTNIDICHYGVKGWSGNFHQHLMKPPEEIAKIKAERAELEAKFGSMRVM